MENSKLYKSGLPSAREVVIKHPWAGGPFTSWFGVHCGLWGEMMTARGVWLALCDAMLGSGVIFACGFSVLLFLYVHHRGWARLEGDHPRAPFLLSLDHMAASTVPRTNRSCTGTVGTVSCSEG